MTIEEKLRDYILARYKSLREFSCFANLPNSTVNTILSRGVINAKVGNIIQICKVLNISADALADGKIEPRRDCVNPMLDVKDIVDDTKVKLTHAVTLDGNRVDIDTLEHMVDALHIGYELTKKRTTCKNGILGEKTKNIDNIFNV